MFRDDAQLARCCRALLGQARMEELWTLTGPTPHALELVDADGGPLSSGERILLLAAFAFWNGRGGLQLAQIIESLDVGPTAALCSLVVAVKLGGEDVDAWLREYGVGAGLRIQ